MTGTRSTARILLAFDGSPAARAALLRAGELFPGAHLTIVSVAHGPDALDDAAGAARAVLPDRVIREALARLHESALTQARELAEAACREAAGAGLRAEARTVVSEHSIWSSIRRVARELGADAVVCGTRGHGAAVRAVLGSVAAALVRHGELPVLVVPAEAPAASGPLLLAFDGSDPARRALESAAGLLPAREAIVLHVWKSLLGHTLTGAAMLHAPLEEIRESAGELGRVLEESVRAITEDGLARALEHGLRARPMTVESDGSVAQTVMRVADESDAAVVVLGRTGHGAIAGALLGSVSASLMHGSDRPVLFTP